MSMPISIHRTKFVTASVALTTCLVVASFFAWLQTPHAITTLADDFRARSCLLVETKSKLRGYVVITTFGVYHTALTGVSHIKCIGVPWLPALPRFVYVGFPP